MILGITNSYFSNPKYKIQSLNNKNVPTPSNIKFSTMPNDSVNFTGKSAPSMYATVFEYLAAEIMGRNKKLQVDGSMLSASKVEDALKNLFDSNKVFTPFKKTIVEKIKWKSYIPQDIRVGSVNKINEAREVRLTQWKNFLENPTMISENGVPRNPELISKIKNNRALKLVIWDAVTSEIKENNRHLPVPFNEKALLETIKGFETIEPKDRAVRCAAPSFLDIYTHRLRDNLLMDMNLSDNESVWVKVPSIKHDPEHKDANVAKLEILSCKNWCTRSSVDKAEDALEDGDFYLYLERGKFNLWEPLVGMTTSSGKLDQIQGVENNNIVPLALVDEIKDFIQKNGLKCHSAVVDEGPKATQAIMISEKLNEYDSALKKTFAKAVKENDDFAMLKFLGVETKKLEDGSLEIKGYKPSCTLNAKSGISIPYSMFGLNEDTLLQNVKVINGNLILDNKNSLYNSRITKFPPKLEKVTGRVVCSAEQFEKFGEDIKRVTGNDSRKIIVHSA